MVPGLEVHSPGKAGPGRWFFFRAGDCGLLAALLLAAVFAGVGITGKILEPESAALAGGARKIDAKQYEELIQKGVLSGREALYFHAVEPGGESGGGSDAGPR